MIGLEKTHFRWKDPDHDPVAVAAVLRGSLRSLLGVVAVSSTVFLIFLNVMYDVPVLKPLAALAAIILFICTVSYIHVRVPPYVVVKDTHLYRGVNDETDEEWKYKDIVHCRFSSRVVDGKPDNALEIETSDGEQSHIRIAPEIPVSALRSFLLSRGIKELEAQSGGATCRRG